jgi:GTP1/OBG
MTAQLPVGSNGKPVPRAASTRAQKTKKGAIAQLRDALEDSVVATPAWNAAAAAQLQEKWSKSDSTRRSRIKQPANGVQVLGKGIRRLPDAIEYDFTQMDDSDIDDDGEPNPSGKRLPREVACFDTAAINVRSGDGGNGCCAFLREKFMPNGGPAGGTGGDGGSVWMEADEGMNSLSRFRNRVHWKADSGVNGMGKSQHGANSKDLTIKVPPGTIVRVRQEGDEDEDDEQPPVAELLNHGVRSYSLPCRMCCCHRVVDVVAAVSGRRCARFPVHATICLPSKNRWQTDAIAAKIASRSTHVLRCAQGTGR